MGQELGYIILAAVVVGLAVLSFFIVKYYNDPYQSSWLSNMTTVIGLTLVFITCFVIPVDIFVVSSFQNGAGEFVIDLPTRESIVNAFTIVYTVVYGCCLVVAFIVIPFAYFFYEEDDVDVSMGRRVLGALKYTIFTIVAFIVLLIVGLVLSPSIEDDLRAHDFSWIKDLFNSNSRGLHAITFCISCLGLVGLAAYVFYTAVGFGGFPIGLMKGQRSKADEISSRRYGVGGRSSRRGVGRGGDVSIQKSGKSRCAPLWTCLRPFMFIFGIIYLLFALLLVTSLVITSVDKLMHSACGVFQSAVQCGYILNSPTLFNPFDKLLGLLVPFFPLDLVVLGLAIFYVFQATLSGVSRIGIRLLWIHIFKVKPRRTPPQGLLLCSVVLMLVMLVLNAEVLTLAPQYATFGTQQYVWPNTTTLLPCSVDAGAGNCTMSAIATLVNRVNVQMPFFGVVYFWANWAFVGVFLVAAVIIAIRKAPLDVDSDDDLEQLHDDEERL